MRLNDFTDHFNRELSNYLDSLEGIPNILLDAMKYSALNGGKRLRPYMVYIGSHFGKIDAHDMMRFAIGVELIHCYSLVHDDLPCMDNDTLRRGMPTTHIKYNDAIATLSGDALLNQANELLSELSCKNKDYATATNYIIKQAGSSGMIAGQVLDMQIGDISETDIIMMYSLKTSALFKAALVGAAIAARCEKNIIKILEEYSHNLGIAFQIADDILDITSTTDELGKNIQSDIEGDKNTIIKAVGYENACKIKESYENNARLNAMKLENSDKLIKLLEMLVDRNN